ncbi:MAG: NnrS family protein [Rhodoferax sp.]|uniref:NnrS family protein n=1 Tax=Rhodoferax sp. TaxID=50421 RepID=UPI001B3ECAB7|nr:NnrS family protein [Rhodoferax sp.]MBP9905683.1 NnrS family protein [Rhodoferax sp.]
MKPVELPIFQGTKAPPSPPTGWPFLRLGFRPFYLAGALTAAALVPLWLLVFLGGIPFTPAVPGLLWHAHEMLFGFAAAIIIGFLMTAGKNWTGLQTPRGPALGALALLWLAARVAGLASSSSVYAMLDVLLLPVVALVFAVLLLRAENYRNLPLALILLLLGASNLCFHLALGGWINLDPMRALYAALALITLIECVIAGRVIPGFTMAGCPGVRLVSSPGLERVVLGLTSVALLLWVIWPGAAWTAPVLAVLSAAHFRRMWQWRTRRIFGQPTVWVLHAAYSWLPLAFLLLAGAQMGWVTASAGVHALGLGATGGLIIGMITRTARGHTGRTLGASRTETLAYALVLLAAMVRVLAALLSPQFYAGLLVLAATAWSLAFALYLWQFTPWLFQTRRDGKDG